MNERKLFASMKPKVKGKILEYEFRVIAFLEDKIFTADWLE